MQIEGARALVTGASSGIGEALVRELAERGASRIILVARRSDELRRVADSVARPGLEVVVRPVDLADHAAATELAASLVDEELDLLLANAGFGDGALFDQSDWARVERMVQVNLVSVMQLTRAAVPGMIERRRGGVLVVGSGSGHTPMPRAVAYSTTKYALNGFCENLRLDLTGTGVVVTQVAPGPVRSGFDEAAGLADGMDSGLPGFMTIGSAQCAHEAVEGWLKEEPVVWPGRAYRALMWLTGVVPRPLFRAMMAGSGTKAARARGL